MELKYKSKVKIEVAERKNNTEEKKMYEFECRSPTSDFWSDVFEEYLGTGNPTGRITMIRGLTPYGEEGGRTTSVTVSSTTSSTDLKLTVTGSITWNETDPLRTIEVIATRPDGNNVTYFRANLPSDVPASPGAVISVTYDVTIYIANVSNTGALLGADTNFYQFFSHVGDRLRGSTTLKYKIERVLWRDVTGTQSFTLSATTSPGDRRVTVPVQNAPSRIDAVAYVEVQAWTGGTYASVITYYHSDPTRRPSISQGQTIYFELSFTVTA